MHVRWSERDNKKRGTAKVGDIKSAGMEKKETMNTDIFQALFPIYYPSKLCGLFPARFTKQANGRYEGRLSVIDVIYSLIIFGIVMGLQLWGLWREMRDGWENSTRLKNRTAVIPTCSDIFSVMTLAAIAILGSPFRWKHAQNVLNKLAEVDEILGIIAPKKTRRYTIVLSTLALLGLLLNTTLDMSWWTRDSNANRKMDDKGPINYFPIYIMYMIIVTLEIQYSLVTYNIGLRFFRLNKCLESILKNGKMTDQFRKDLGLGAYNFSSSIFSQPLRDTNRVIRSNKNGQYTLVFAGTLTAGDFKSREQPTTYVRQDPGNLRESKILKWYPVTFETKNVSNKIAQLVTAHSSLCDTVTSINNAFGLAMLVVTLTCLLHLVITPYFLIVEVNGNRQWLFLIVQTLWCIYHIARMLVVIQPTYFACTQSKETAIVVSQLLSSNLSEEYRKELEVFSLQLLHRPLDFTACGLFSLDRTLVTSIAGAVTTYLVILIQFQKEDHTKDDVDNILKNATQILKNASSLHNFSTIKLNT